MVCNRCIQVVKQELQALGFHAEHISLGEVELKQEHLSPEELNRIDAALINVGFERIDDRKSRLIESIKKKVIDMIHHADELHLKMNWSTILSEALHFDYNYLSNLFSSVEGITLEQYIIRQKIEKVKELLFYDELTLSEIANRLGYSSVAHLSGQFKKVTGLTPSELKKTHNPGLTRKPLDKLT
jgi:YesN/AraC family two-component response regulator